MKCQRFGCKKEIVADHNYLIWDYCGTRYRTCSYDHLMSLRAAIKSTMRAKHKGVASFITRTEPTKPGLTLVKSIWKDFREAR